ncbi:hypothetical protein [Planococcus plakortidis]
MKVCIPKDAEKLRKQIEALKYLLSIDTNEKDKAIHRRALEECKQAMKTI